MNKENVDFLIVDMEDVLYDLENVSYASESHTKESIEWVKFKLSEITRSLRAEMNEGKEDDDRIYFGDEINDN